MESAAGAHASWPPRARCLFCLSYPCRAVWAALASVVLCLGLAAWDQTGTPARAQLERSAQTPGTEMFWRPERSEVVGG